MIKRIKSLVLLGVMIIGLSGCSNNGHPVDDDNVKITLVLSTGGVNDQSFNQSAWEGALKAKEEYGVEVSYLESNNDADYIQNIETAVDMDSDLVVGVGFQLGDAIKEAAESYPEQQFAIIDSTYEEIPDNIRCLTFDEEQGGYAAGLIASKMTKTGKVGFVGGVDIPTCSRWADGFKRGMEEELSDSNVLIQYTNSFTDAAKGRVLAEQMVKEGCDILFMASGAGNSGALEVIREHNIMGIGVDMPSNYLAPDHIITSGLKNISDALKMTIQDFTEGKYTSGEVKYSLSNGGVGFEETDLLSDETIRYVKEKLENK